MNKKAREQAVQAAQLRSALADQVMRQRERDDAIRAWQEKKAQQPGWLGVGLLEDSRDVAKRFGGPKTGAMVSGLSEGGAAARAGIDTLDIILAVGGTTVDKASDLAAIIAQHSAGDEVVLTIFRYRELQEEQVTLHLGAHPTWVQENPRPNE